MKTKIVEVIIIVLVVLMIGGILSSVKGNSNEDVTIITSEFENTDVYDGSGYISEDLFDEDNENIIGKVNGAIGEGISKGVNKAIDLFFEMMKKLVS